MILWVAYNGTSYFGWQKTKMGPSIQESLAQAIFSVTQERVTPEGASRTDRGVHAQGQVVAIDLQAPWEPWRLQKALNARLPPTIRIWKVEPKPPSFHPSLSALHKTYLYRLFAHPVYLPHERHFAWHIYHPLAIEAMRKGASLLLGTHDFSSFSNDRNESPVCTLFSIAIEQDASSHWSLKIVGDRFLYKMVRNLVGTLVYVGMGKIASEEIPSILEAKDRKRAGITAPARGLFLKEIAFHQENPS